AAAPLKGKQALVPGVGGPLARPAAVALAEAGATVSLLTQADDRAQEVEAQSILNECWSLGRDGEVHRLDSRDAAAVDAAIEELEARLGRVAVLVTVHAEPARLAASEVTPEAWDAQLARSATSGAVPV